MNYATGDECRSSSSLATHTHTPNSPAVITPRPKPNHATRVSRSRTTLPRNQVAPRKINQTFLSSLTPLLSLPLTTFRGDALIDQDGSRGIQCAKADWACQTGLEFFLAPVCPLSLPPCFGPSGQVGWGNVWHLVKGKGTIVCQL